MMALRTQLIALLCVGLLTLGASCKRQMPPVGEEGDKDSSSEESYALPGLDHGLLQSPVNILSDEVEGGHHEISVNLHDAAPELLQNKGDTIELDFPSGSTVGFDGREYELKQLHFHTPSEHQIDGVTYPMEMHVVNSARAQSPGEPPCYLVFSFLYRMGHEDPFIASFLDEVPSEEGSEALEPGQVYLTDAGRKLEFEYFHYRGSLTTPPYTETVEWLIATEIRQASPEQIRRINLIEGDNARHVQALFGRPVEN